MSYARFASKTKLNYSRGLNYASPSQIPNLKYRLFSNPLVLNRIENEIKNEVIPNPIPPEPTYNNKMVGIFSPSILEIDQFIIDSINYYWSVVPQFEPFLILEYDGTQNDLIRALNEAYSLGKIYIFGFTTASALAGSLSWLNEHPEVQGVTISASSGTLAIPKKIFREVADAKVVFETSQNYIFNGVPGNGAIYYIYNSSQLVSASFKTELTKYCTQYSVPFLEYPYINLSDITYSNVQNTIQQIYDDMSNNSYTKSSICISMVDFSEEFYPLFNSGMANVSSLGASYFDLIGLTGVIVPNSPVEARNYFNNIIYETLTIGVSLMPTKIFFETPTTKKYALGALNILYQLNNYGGYVNQVGTYSKSYILDPVTRDNLAYPTVFLNQYHQITNKFETINILYEDIDQTLFECVLTP